MSFLSLHHRLRGPIAESLKVSLGLTNLHALPRIEKVTINVGINTTKMGNKEMMDYVAESIAQIAGQRPVFRTARKAISNFKIRKGAVVGAMVTLRGRRMEDFLDRLIHVALPRVRDFRGVHPRLDGHGNFSIGISEHTVFPEIPPPDASKIFGFQVTVTTTAKKDEAAEILLRQVGIPFRREKSEARNPKNE